MSKQVRLNRFIADTGLCSRREADKLIASGKVQVDTQIATLGMSVSGKEKILVNGKRLRRRSKDYVYIALYKPVGITCTTDLRRRDNIITYLGYPERVFPIGRLDRDSEGLILLTNDGSVVNHILRASNHKPKEYLVSVDQEIDADFLQKMSSGVPILGTVTKPCQVRQTSPKRFRIILEQGLNRQIRRMCEYCGYEVQSLKRLRIMHITLGNMQPGDWRYLTAKEIAELKK